MKKTMKARMKPILRFSVISILLRGAIKSRVMVDPLVSTKDESVDMENDFGWYALAGLEVRLCPHLSLYAEARYTSTEISISHPDDYDFPVEESDFDMSGVGARAGLMFDF